MRNRRPNRSVDVVTPYALFSDFGQSVTRTADNIRVEKRFKRNTLDKYLIVMVKGRSQII